MILWRRLELEDSLSLPTALALKMFCDQVAFYYEGLDFLFVWFIFVTGPHASQDGLELTL